MKLKCAVIGLGLLGSQHAERLMQYENTRLVAVCDIKREKAEAWGKLHGVESFSSVEEMFTKLEIDLAVVATQDPYHKAPVIAACKAGVRYIICEKPLATTVEDAMEIAEAAGASGSQIKVLFPNRFYPLDIAVRILLKNGILGKPLYGEMRMDDSISVPIGLWGKDSKAFSRLSSPAHFLLSHAVDLLRFYFEPREIVKVYAISKQSLIGSEVDYVDAYLTFSDGMTIRLKSEWTKHMEPLVENYVQLTAEKGGLVYNKVPGFAMQGGLRFDFPENAGDAGKIAALLKEHGIESSSQEYKGNNGFGIELYQQGGNTFDWNHGICLYADSFLGAEYPDSPLTSLEGGVRQVMVVDAILRSARTGSEISIQYDRE